MFYKHGNPPLNSTQAQATNPTTSVLLAEVVLAGETNSDAQLYEARVIIGCSTTTQEFWVEQCLSTGLGSTALRTGAYELGRMVLYGTVQSAQYMVRFKGTAGDRVRVRLSAALTGTAAAKVQVEAVP